MPLPDLAAACRYLEGWLARVGVPESIAVPGCLNGDAAIVTLSGTW